MAYLLNGSSSDSPVWYQNLDNDRPRDDYPVLDSSHGIVYCIDKDTAFYSNDPDGEPGQIISVDIIWGDLSFTYSDGTWNPDTHEYDGEGWTVDKEDGNTVKVENNGNTAVSVSFAYNATVDGITGSFTDGENPVSAPVALPENGSSTVYLILAGKPEQNLDHAKIGSVTVTKGKENFDSCAASDYVDCHRRDHLGLVLPGHGPGPGSGLRPGGGGIQCPGH